MKKVSIILVSLSLVFFFFNASYALDVQKVDNFSDWQEYVAGNGTSNYSIKNGELTLNATNSTWYSLKNNSTTALGMMSTITVNKSKGDTIAGFWDPLATLNNGYRIIVEFMLRNEKDNKFIQVEIKEETIKGEDGKILFEGYIGSSNKNIQEWEIGKPITVGYAIINNEILFYAQGYESYIKWSPMKKISKYTYNYPSPEPNVFAIGDNSTISATYSNTYLIQ